VVVHHTEDGYSAKTVDDVDEGRMSRVRSNIVSPIVKTGASIARGAGLA
jgi:hypothetical protein